MKCVIIILLFSCLSATLCLSQKAQLPPNILILLGDDIDRDSLGPWGGPAITPHLDQLAKEGVTFDRGYCNVAMCAPFRQEFYSGRCAWRTRALPNHSRSTDDTKSLPHYLRPLGYQVGLLGKNHVGPREAYPFDKVGDLPMKADANPQAIELAEKYIKQAIAADTPFCLVVAAHDGHGPYTHGDTAPYEGRKVELPQDSIDTAEYRRNLAKHYAEVTNLDALLGSLREVLEKNDLTENTLVLFCSEQGSAFPFSKWTCFDDGLASGIVASLPGKIPEGIRAKEILWMSDIAPTLIEMAGGEVASDAFDGKSQWANFLGEGKKIHDYAYGAFLNCNILDNQERIFPIRSIRDRRYTLIWCPRAGEEITSNTSLTEALQYIESGKAADSYGVAASWVDRLWKKGTKKQAALVKRFHHRPEWALYDREEDPEELNNLMESEDHTAVRKQLQGSLQEWLAKWDDSDPVATEKAFVKKKKQP